MQDVQVRQSVKVLEQHLLTLPGAAMSEHIDTLQLHGVEVAHHFGGGSYAKETFIPAGVRLEQHSHPHAHLSILASGRASVEAGESLRDFEAPACINLEAGVEHAVTALTDVVWYCIHATHDTDAATVDTSILSGAKHG